MLSSGKYFFLAVISGSVIGIFADGCCKAANETVQDQTADRLSYFDAKTFFSCLNYEGSKLKYHRHVHISDI